MYWLNRTHHYARETLFGNRVLRCIQQRPASLTGMFEQVVSSHPDAEAVVSNGCRLSYAAWYDQSRKMASVLANHGVACGDRVVLNLGNSHEFPIAFMACVLLGAIAVPVGTRQRAPELEYIYNHCAASAVFFDRDTASVQPPSAALPGVACWIGCDASVQAANGLDFSQQLGAAEPLQSIARPAAEDCLAILYTSGTTGQPKGAMLTHVGVLHTILHWTSRFDLSLGERTIVTVPISHVTGLGAQLLVMLGCAGCTIMQHSFDADNFLQLAERERLSYQIMVPAMYRLLLMRGRFEKRDLSRWRIGAFGGAPMPEDTIVQMAARLPHLLLANGYGATETTSPSTLMPLDACRTVLDSIGTAVDCCELLIMDDNGREVAAGESGEIWLAGPHVIPSYWNRPEASESAFCGSYWRSGDIGSVDEQGFVRIFDRKKDMINRGGYKIFSAEVENVISDHPAVQDVALVAVPCEVLGQRCCAFICASAPLDLKALTDFLEHKVADYKIPDYLQVQSELLPRNANGKIQKSVLRERATQLYRAQFAQQGPAGG